MVKTILKFSSFVFRGKDVADGLNMNLRQLYFYAYRKEHARRRILFSPPLGDSAGLANSIQECEVHKYII